MGSITHTVVTDGHRLQILFVDLNNFASFPTLAVGILIAALRDRGHDTRLIVPLAYDVPAVEREKVERLQHDLMRRVHLSTNPLWRPARDILRMAWYWSQRRPHPVVLREVRTALRAKPDLVMLSAYLQHFNSVREVGKLCQAAGVPLLLGGPAFNLRETADAWRAIPGLLAIYGGEADLNVPDLAVAASEGADLLQFPGVTLPDGRHSHPSPPLRDLDSVPVPDFSDFPWSRYPTRIIPVMTGRGCQWAKCDFCSDVVSASGRTFRTRSLHSVLNELQEQSRRTGSSNFLFLDLKLNSNVALWRGIAEHMQNVVPGAQWIGTVHVDRRRDNGLSRVDLKAAARSGMRRVSFGLESGSQTLLDSMNKGSTVEGNSAFIRNAHEASISVRCTMFKGFPGETAEDLDASADFLERHTAYIDRIRFNDFSIQEDTPIWKRMVEGASQERGLRITAKDARNAKLRYVNDASTSQAYRLAKSRVLDAVHAINRRPLRPEAQMFDGLM